MALRAFSNAISRSSSDMSSFDSKHVVWPLDLSVSILIEACVRGEDGENAWVTDPKIRGPVRRMVAFIENILMYWSRLSDGDARSAFFAIERLGFLTLTVSRASGGIFPTFSDR